MQDDRNQLPEGTDKIIEGASAPIITNSGAVGLAESPALDIEDDGDTLVVADVGGTRSERAGAVIDKIRTGREKLSGQAAAKARGFVGQGLERSAEALANVGRLVGETADGLDERLGPDYGDYARRAAGAIEGVANNLASKDPDELIDDTREFVRQSPGVALAGAAIIGFALARLIKSGLAEADDDRNRGSRDSES